MPTKKARQHDDANFSTTRKTLEEFEQFLSETAGGSIDLVAWVEEVPGELRDEFVPRLLRTYLRYCNDHGLTVAYNMLMQQFPDYRDVIDEMSGRIQPQGEQTAAETVSIRKLDTSTVYAVQDQHWKKGGQGVLHKAEDESIGDRQLVVKFLTDTMHEKDFQKEVEVTAKLDHPGVVAVYSQGVEEQGAKKRPFFAMRLIDGTPLEERIAEFHNRINKADPRERNKEFTQSGGISDLIECIISACNTISHAHSKGVLHCDIKPKNIIFGRFRSTIVLDWGSASSCDIPQDQHHDATARINLPADSTAGLTVAYASPEQFANEKQLLLTPASDVYSLGATLYQALTGTPPFGSDRQRDSVCTGSREMNPAVPKRLSAICEKAMQHSQADRYASAEDLAGDLRNWLRDEPISVVQDNWKDRTFRLARRNQGLSLALLLLFVLMSAGGALFTLMSLREKELALQHLRTLNNLELTLSLVEDVCEPLGNDEVQNLKEFDAIAKQVDRFAEKYISNSSLKDNTTLARVYKIRAIINYYYFTRAPGETPKSSNAENRVSDLRIAIDFLNRAEQQSMGASLLSIAEIRLTQARWLWRLSNTQKENGGEVDETRRLAIEKLDEVIANLNQAKLKGDAAPRLSILAEAFHLRGEYLSEIKPAARLAGTNSASEQLKLSLESFNSAVELLEAKHKAADSAAVARNLARAYGFRGDVRRSLGDLGKALQDYEDSLRIRKQLANSQMSGANNRVESSFQLARGYANFGMLLRDFGDDVPVKTLTADKPQESNEPIEVFFIDHYLQHAIEIQDALKGKGDTRFKNDLSWTSNIAVELYLFAAERPEVNESDKQASLEKANRLVDQVIQTICSQPLAALAKSAETLEEATRHLVANEKRTLATSLMLKLRIDRLLNGSDNQLSALPRRISSLFPISKDLARFREEELLVFAIAIVADPDHTKEHVREILVELRNRRYIPMNRIRKHLIGIGMSPEEIEKHLRPLAETK